MAPNVSRSARNNRDRVKVPGVCFRNRSRLSRPDEWGHIRAIGRTEGGGRSCMWTSGCWGGPSQCGDRGDRAPAERQKPPSRGVFTPHGPTGTQPRALVTVPVSSLPSGCCGHNSLAAPPGGWPRPSRLCLGLLLHVCVSASVPYTDTVTGCRATCSRRTHLGLFS